MEWTDERVSVLKSMWGDGCSATQIAVELGGVTRNAVVGKLHRLGLCRNGPIAKPRPGRPKVALAKVIAIKTRIARQPIEVLELPPEPPPPPVMDVMPFGRRCTLHDLDKHKCRWPIGDPGLADFFFCGCPPLDHLPYCSYHTRVAYQPAVERRRRPARS